MTHREMMKLLYGAHILPVTPNNSLVTDHACWLCRVHRLDSVPACAVDHRFWLNSVCVVPAHLCGDGIVLHATRVKYSKEQMMQHLTLMVVWRRYISLVFTASLNPRTRPRMLQLKASYEARGHMRSLPQLLWCSLCS